jgi:hypothetical protein
MSGWDGKCAAIRDNYDNDDGIMRAERNEMQNSFANPRNWNSLKCICKLLSWNQ